MKYNQKIAVFLIISLLLTLAIIEWNPEREMSEAARENFWTEKTHNEEKFDVVIYGDSRIYRGVSPAHITEETNLSAYNFGYSSGSMSSQMLEFASSHLDHSNRPVFILGISPHSLTKDAMKDEQFLQEDGRSALEVLKRKKLAGFMSIFDPIRPSDLFAKGANQDQLNEGGWMSNPGNEIDTLNGLEHYRKVLTDNPIVPEAVEDMLSFVTELSSKGVRVIGFRPPTMSSMEALENDLLNFDQMDLAKRFEEHGGEWLNFDLNEFQTYDGSHLQKESAIFLSKKLAEKLID